MCAEVGVFLWNGLRGCRKAIRVRSLQTPSDPDQTIGRRLSDTMMPPQSFLLSRSTPDCLSRTPIIGRIPLAKSAAFGLAEVLGDFIVRSPPMSLSPQPLPPVPEDTARIAR